MIHIPALIILGAGVAAGGASWDGVKRRFAQSPPKKPETLPPDALNGTVLPKVNGDAAHHLNGASQHLNGTTALTPVVAETPAVAGTTGAGLGRLGLTSGAVGLAVVAQVAVPFVAPIAIFSVGVLATPLFKEAYTAIFKDRRIKVDILDATVVTLCLAFGQVFAAAFMVWVLDLADYLLERTRNRSRQQISDIFGVQSRTAWKVMEGGQEISIDIDDLIPGDIIVVNTGEEIPIDGTVVNGSAMIDQQSLTGESAPAERGENEEVFATTMIVAGKVFIRVSQVGSETVAAKIVQIIDNAAEFKVELQSTGEKIADRMVVPTLGLGALGFMTAGPGGMLAIINADYGTGIRVAAPLSLLSILGHSAKNGVLIKDSQVFEALPKIDSVVFDKTGTLTHEVPKVSRVVSSGPAFSEDDILRYTAAAEHKFTHPIAKSVLNEAAQRGLELPLPDNSRYDVGLGIEVVVENRLIRVGSARYMEQDGLILPEVIAEALSDAHDNGRSAILIAIEHDVAGLIEMEASVREEAMEIMAALRKRGIDEIVLLSGDHAAPTGALSKRLGADRFFAGVMPDEKADYIKLLQSEGKKVMMVGDGINDSAALSLADVSVSLHGASTVAIDVADVVFMDGDLKKFDYLFEASEAVHKNVRRSFNMIAVPNTLCIIGGLTGIVGLTASLVLNNGFNLMAALNGAFAQNDATTPKSITNTTMPNTRTPTSVKMEEAAGYKNEKTPKVYGSV